MTRAVETFEPAGGGPLLDDRLFSGLSAVVGVLVVAGLVLFAWLLVRNLRGMRRVAQDPPAAGRGAPSVAAPVAQRLQELDDLHRRGVITDAERSLARHQVLTSPVRPGSPA